jgi:hypothetical protein
MEIGKQQKISGSSAPFFWLNIFCQLAALKLDCIKREEGR